MTVMTGDLPFSNKEFEMMICLLTDKY